MRVHRFLTPLAAATILVLAVSPSHAMRWHHGTKAHGMSSSYDRSMRHRGGMDCPDPVMTAMGAFSPRGGLMSSEVGEKKGEKILRKYYDHHGWLGVETDFSREGNGNPVVSKVFSGSPAERAGIRVGDVLTSLNGIDYGAVYLEHLRGVTCRGFREGDMVQITARRGVDIVPLTMTLVEPNRADLAQMESDLREQLQAAR